MPSAREKHEAAVNRLITVLDDDFGFTQTFTDHVENLQPGQYSKSHNLRLDPPRNLPVDLLIRTHEGQALMLKVFAYGDSQRIHSSVFRVISYAVEAIPMGIPLVQVIEKQEMLDLASKFPFAAKLMNQHNLDSNSPGFSTITTLANFLDRSWIDHLTEGRVINE